LQKAKYQRRNLHPRQLHLNRRAGCTSTQAEAFCIAKWRERRAKHSTENKLYRTTILCGHLVMNEWFAHTINILSRARVAQTPQD